MPVSPTARRAGSGPKRSELARRLDAMEVDVESDGEWFARPEYSNPIPVQLRHAERRHPGREYVWEHDSDRFGVLVWRIA